MVNGKWGEWGECNEKNEKKANKSDTAPDMCSAKRRRACINRRDCRWTGTYCTEKGDQRPAKAGRPGQ